MQNIVNELDIAREEALQDAYHKYDGEKLKNAFDEINNYYNTMIDRVQQNTNGHAIVAYDKYFRGMAGDIPVKGRAYVGPPHGDDYMSLNIPEVELIKVEMGTLSLENVHEQTPEICLAAVRRNGLTLRYVVNQTEEICLAAVKEWWVALKYVVNQTPEMCIAAMCRDRRALQYVVNKTDELCL